MGSIPIRSTNFMAPLGGSTALSLNSGATNKFYVNRGGAVYCALKPAAAACQRLDTHDTDQGIADSPDYTPPVVSRLQRQRTGRNFMVGHPWTDSPWVKSLDLNLQVAPTTNMHSAVCTGEGRGPGLNAPTGHFTFMTGDSDYSDRSHNVCRTQIAVTTPSYFL